MKQPEITAAYIQVFDPSVLGAMFGTETTVVASVLQTFMVGTGENLDSLAQAVAGQDFANVAALAHKITGACRMSGALALGQAACKLEQAAKQGDTAAVQQGVRDLDFQWHLALTAIGSLNTRSA